MKLFKSKKAVAVGLATGLALGLGGVAFGFWTSTGTGSGGASTAAGQSNLVYTQSPDPITNGMFPGDSTQTFTVNVKNNQPAGGQNEDVQNVQAYITTSNASCDGSNFLLNGVAAPSTSATAVSIANWTAIDLAPQASSTSGNNTIQFNNKATAQDFCKAVTVTIHYQTV
jgi:hypothetical protein